MGKRYGRPDASAFHDDFEGDWNPSGGEGAGDPSSLEFLLAVPVDERPSCASPSVDQGQGQPVEEWNAGPTCTPTRLAPPRDPSADPSREGGLTRINLSPSAGPIAVPRGKPIEHPLTRLRADPGQTGFGLDDIDNGFELNQPASDDSLEAMLAVPPPVLGGVSKPAQPLPPPVADAAPAPKPSDHKTAIAQGKRRPSRPRAPIVFPKIGTAIGGFKLVDLLGRGAFARVFKAEDLGLGNRLIALKISRAEGHEPRVMARLQHTNIMPIYSLTDDPKTGLRLMVMPYFGGANLAEVLDAAQESPHQKTMGRSLVEALDRVGKPLGVQDPQDSPSVRSRVNTTPTPTPVASADPLSDRVSSGAVTRIRAHQSGLGSATEAGPVSRLRARSGVRSFMRRLPFWSIAPEDSEWFGTPGEFDTEAAQPNRTFLRGTTFVRASVWIMARLADGLEHAHSRHFLHRDLKPSNILITADGTPMLLDFNLAAHSSSHTSPEEGMRAKLGGTLPYMAPEHLDAFNPESKTRAETVDERSDIYALGLILFEMISGQHPFMLATPKDQPLVATLNAMIEQRLGEVPSLRSQHPDVPWSLDAIVRKAMSPKPEDRYQTAAAFADDLERFLEDRPLRHVKEPSIRETVAKWARRNPRLSSASSVAIFSIALLGVLGFTASSLASNLKQAAARLNLRQIEASAHECQFLLNSASGANIEDHQRRGTALAKDLRTRLKLGGKQDWTKASWFALLSPDEQKDVRESISEVVVLEARARVALAHDKGERALREALNWSIAWLNEVEQFEPEPTHTLVADRARYYAALGDSVRAHADQTRAEAIPLRTARDLYLAAMTEMSQGRNDVAESLLSRAVATEVRSYWSWFALGLCHLQQNRFQEASSDFASCALIMPKFAWSYLNWGYAQSRQGRLAEARKSYDRAIELSSSFADAIIRRGLVELELNDGVAAETDFRKAISIGRGDPLVRAGLAEALGKQRRLDEAIEVIDQVIHSHPDDPRWLVTRGMLRIQADPASAEADFRAALELDPKLAIAQFALARSLKGRQDAQALVLADAAYQADPNLIDALELRMLLRARAGKIEASADAKRLLLTPTPNRIYNAACALSKLGYQLKDARLLDESVELLFRAFAAGFPKDSAVKDPDLAPIRSRF